MTWYVKGRVIDHDNNIGIAAIPVQFAETFGSYIDETFTDHNGYYQFAIPNSVGSGVVGPAILGYRTGSTLSSALNLGAGSIVLRDFNFGNDTHRQRHERDSKFHRGFDVDYGIQSYQILNGGFTVTNLHDLLVAFRQAGRDRIAPYITAYAFIALVSHTSSFTGDSVFRKTTNNSLTANADLLRTIAGSFTGNSALRRTQTGSFTADADFLRHQAGSFAADSVILRTFAGSLTGDAFILAAGGFGQFTMDSVVLRTITGSLTGNAVVLRTTAGSLTADAIVLRTTSASLTANADLFKNMTGSFTADANIKSLMDAFESDAFQNDTFE